jgi:hypothetical protein
MRLLWVPSPPQGRRDAGASEGVNGPGMARSALPRQDAASKRPPRSCPQHGNPPQAGGLAGVSFFSPLFLDKQEKGLARVRSGLVEAATVRRAKQPTSLNQSGFEQPSKCFFRPLSSLFLRPRTRASGRVTFLAHARKVTKRTRPRGAGPSGKPWPDLLQPGRPDATSCRGRAEWAFLGPFTRLPQASPGRPRGGLLPHPFPLSRLRERDSTFVLRAPSIP